MTYSFTSGTTGLPKGVIITQSNFATQIYSTKDMTAFRETDIHLSYLPLAHMFERCMLYTTLL
jgi:long-chain acyl-CoA synthetase